MKYAIAGGVALVGIVGGYFFLSSEETITNYPSSGTDIIAFGDSLIQGVGATSEHDLVSLLSQRIGQPIVNLGIAGNTTADGLARIDALDQYHPKVVLLLLGGNDHLKKVDIDQTFANLATLIEDIQARGSIVLLLGVRGGLFADKFEERYKELSKQYHTAYVSDVLDGLFAHPEYMSDGVHPNDKGYVLLADRVEPVLRELLQ